MVANCGDTRCVLVKKDGTAVRLTVDHKPHMPEEKARIEGVGGFVTSFKSRSGVVTSRVCGAIAVSRAFGDIGLQPYLVATPHISDLITLTPDDAALIVACDGLWDIFEDEEAAQVVLSTADPEKAAKRLRNKAYGRGSTDNISVVICHTEHYTKTVSMDEDD